MPTTPEPHATGLQVADASCVPLPIEHIGALLRQLPAGGATAFQVTPLLGDASDRRYYRLHFPSPINGLNSAVLMRLPQPYTAGELPFVNVQRFLTLKGLPVPRLYVDDAEHGFVVLEDLGDLTLEAACRNAGREQVRVWYRQAVDVLLTIQHPDPLGSDVSCVAFRLAFDVEKFMWELDFFLTHMVEGFCRQRLPTAEASALRGQFRQLSILLTQQPRVLTHRDYHSRNLMLHEGRLRLIDFQDARLGPCQYDLASLLYDSYVVLPAELRADLLDYYMDRKEALDGSPLDRRAFLHVFDYMCLQRNLKALGTFAFQTVIKRTSRYADAIPVTLTYLWQHLGRHPELQQLRDLLERYLVGGCSAVPPDVGTHTPDNSPAR